MTIARPLLPLDCYLPIQLPDPIGPVPQYVNPGKFSLWMAVLNHCLDHPSATTVYPKHSWKLINDPVIGTFVPVFVLSLGTIIMGTVDFAVPAGRVSAEFAFRLYWRVDCIHLIHSLHFLI
jgi:hypothetical protein